MTAKSPQVSVYFPKDQRAEIDAAAEAAGQTVAAFIRETVMARLHPVRDPELAEQMDALTRHAKEIGVDSPEAVARTLAAVEEEFAPLDPTNAKILELLGESVPVLDERPTTFEGSPIAPPVTSVTTQRQGERCYHFDGNDGVTRWHETATPCPVGTTWAQRIGAADLKTTLDGKTL